MNTITVEQLHAMRDAGTVAEHHTATRRGYVSRKSNGRVEPYIGRFGRGYIHVQPNWRSTSYVIITYYIFAD